MTYMIQFIVYTYTTGYERLNSEVMQSVTMLVCGVYHTVTNTCRYSIISFELLQTRVKTIYSVQLK